MCQQFLHGNITQILCVKSRFTFLAFVVAPKQNFFYFKEIFLLGSSQKYLGLVFYRIFLD